MGEGYMHAKAWKMLVFGIIIILVRLYTAWDIWVVIGALLAIKAIIIMVSHKSMPAKQPKGKK